MALINCPECGKEISNKAKMCIHCGYPITDYMEIDSKKEAEKIPQVSKHWCNGLYRVNEEGKDYCIFCGKRISAYYDLGNDIKSETDLIIDNIVKKYPSNMVAAIKEYRSLTNCTLVEANGIFEPIYKGKKTPSGTKKVQCAETQKRCPQCGGRRYHAFIDDVVLREGKVKSQTTLNINPLKPFTVFNHKEKVVRKPLMKQVSKFICDDCGKIFQ